MFAFTFYGGRSGSNMRARPILIKRPYAPAPSLTQGAPSSDVRLGPLLVLCAELIQDGPYGGVIKRPRNQTPKSAA